MRHGIESTSFWNSAGGMQRHSSTRKSIDSHVFDGGGKHRLRHRSKISHKCSIGFRSGDWEGHDIWITSVSCSSNHWMTDHTCSVDEGIVILEDTPSQQERNVATWGEDDHSIPLWSHGHWPCFLRNELYPNHAKKMHSTTLQNHRNPSLLEPSTQDCRVL